MEAEREKFREYVEKSGVLAALTNVLVHLYEEPNKPSDALEFVKDHLGSKAVDAKQLNILEQKVNDLEVENKSLREQLNKLQITQEEDEDPLKTDDTPEEVGQS